VFFYL